MRRNDAMDTHIMIEVANRDSQAVEKRVRSGTSAVLEAVAVGMLSRGVCSDEALLAVGFSNNPRRLLAPSCRHAPQSACSQLLHNVKNHSSDQSSRRPSLQIHRRALSALVRQATSLLPAIFTMLMSPTNLIHPGQWGCNKRDGLCRSRTRPTPRRFALPAPSVASYRILCFRFVSKSLAIASHRH